MSYKKDSKWKSSKKENLNREGKQNEGRKKGKVKVKFGLPFSQNFILCACLKPLVTKEKGSSVEIENERKITFQAAKNKFCILATKNGFNGFKRN